MSEHPSFPDWLQAEMELRNLTQPKLAAFIGTTQSAVNRWFHGSQPSTATCWRIARLFHVRIERVLLVAGHIPWDEAEFMGEEVTPYGLDPRITAIAATLAADRERLETWIETGEVLARRSARGLPS